MKKTTKLLFKPHYWQAAYTDARRSFQKTSLYKTCKKYPEATLYGVVSILGVVFLLTAKVFASAPILQEAGVNIPIVRRLEPIKKRFKVVEVVYAKEEVKPVTTPVRQDGSLNWLALRECESGNNYQTNTGNGFYGAYQFDYGTWQGMGTGYERADLAPPSVQDDAAQRLYNERGASPWPSCGSQLYT